MSETRATEHGEREDGTGVQAAGLEALLDGLRPAPWIREGACIGMTDVFFSDAPADIEEAKRICTSCPVIEECFQYAIDYREPCGVWGGHLFRNGHVQAVKRRRGRPSKAARAALQLTKEG